MKLQKYLYTHYFILRCFIVFIQLILKLDTDRFSGFEEAIVLHFLKQH